MSLSKSIAATAVALILSTSAMAHSPEMHAKKDSMSCEKMEKNMQMMEKMDHSKMDMKDPAMKAMMANMGKMKQMYQKNCVTNDSKS
ncbi:MULTISPECIES: hypothetical protein [unclassified Psychrobacter]|uniref:hypothetical protein n=1 Tax=unclassified Psychrobacter TaxID=196806 RepID=UPI000C7E5DB1|nr:MULTISPECIES: hypothetical protein [unclassified Psychrobacter]PKG63813.1 hypothetical protein CXF56_10895 [Psychrobacter sp. Choline-02u-13]PKH48064.1 hypothetical protein CXF69_14215 [Psychrobacter sp. Choline-02u-9]PKH80694.1 hypothetical protein CXF60_08745 [Psychrobacter sp. 4Bb]